MLPWIFEWQLRQLRANILFLLPAAGGPLKVSKLV